MTERLTRVDNEEKLPLQKHSSKTRSDDELNPVALQLFHTGNSVADATCVRPRPVGPNHKASRKISWVSIETRPSTNNTEVHKGDMSDLRGATSQGLDFFSGHTLQFFITFRFNSVSRPVSVLCGWQNLLVAPETTIRTRVAQVLQRGWV